MIGFLGLGWRRSTPNPDVWSLVSWTRAYSGYKCYAYYMNTRTERVKRFVFRGDAWGAYFETIQPPNRNDQ